MVYLTKGGQETKVFTCGGIISGKLEVRLKRNLSFSSLLTVVPS